VIRTIIFDFGNVLGHFDYRLTLQRLGEHTDLSAEEMRSAISQADLAPAYEAGQITTAEFLHRAQKVCRLQCDESVLISAWSDIFRPNEEICALVPRLKQRYRLLLGSNTNELHAQQFRRQFADTLAHFDALVLSHEIGVRKPAAGFYRHCQALAQCEPEECLFIDDLPANVEGAMSCGWRGIVYCDVDDLKSRLVAHGIGEPGA
jgi:putative hydrolase of the HAD superfamily